MARRSEERQQGQAGSGARRGGGGGPRASLKDDDSDDDEESGSGSDDSSSEKPKKKKQKKTSKKNDKKESSSSAEEVQSSTSESQPKKKGKKAQKSKKLASSSNESEEESPRRSRRADPAKGKESGKEGTKQEAAKQAMSAQEIKEVAFLDWSAGSIEEMYAQVEEVNGATRGDAKGIVPRDVIRLFVDSVPKKVLACYPLVQQAWDNIPEDQARSLAPSRRACSSNSCALPAMRRSSSSSSPAQARGARARPDHGSSWLVILFLALPPVV